MELVCYLYCFINLDLTSNGVVLCKSWCRVLLYHDRLTYRFMIASFTKISYKLMLFVVYSARLAPIHLLFARLFGCMSLSVYVLVFQVLSKS